VALRLRSPYGKVGVREQSQRDVPIPPHPAAPLILIEAHLALGRLTTLLHGPAGASYLHHRF